MNLTTEFHSIAKPQELQLWVLPVSISLGLILLCVIIILLLKVNLISFVLR